MTLKCDAALERLQLEREYKQIESLIMRELRRDNVACSITELIDTVIYHMDYKVNDRQVDYSIKKLINRHEILIVAREAK